MTDATHRVWHETEVGLVGPHDVADLQHRVTTYQAALAQSIDALTQSGGPTLSLDPSQRWSTFAWSDLSGRCSAFAAESTLWYSPAAYLFAGSAYERGRQLVIELDAWRDELARRSAPLVPPPLDVPHSDLGIAGGLGMAALVVLAIMLLGRR